MQYNEDCESRLQIIDMSDVIDVCLAQKLCNYASGIFIRAHFSAAKATGSTQDSAENFTKVEGLL